MPIPFVKAHACGNDFVLIDSRHVPENLNVFAVAICDRHRGVGADGLEVIYADPQVDARIRLINADGTEAEISGNGTRCVAACLIAERGGTVVAIRTGAGIKVCTLTDRSGQTFEFDMSMGQPDVKEPMKVKLSSSTVTGIPVSMGNPHYVTFVDRFEPGWQVQAAEIEAHPDFKYGTNVELVMVKNKEDIDVRIFERGVGETLSSGTGSCASAVAAIASGRAQSPVRVHTPGGSQTVRWEKGEIVLRGPAQIVCLGELPS